MYRDISMSTFTASYIDSADARYGQLKDYWIKDSQMLTLTIFLTKYNGIFFAAEVQGHVRQRIASEMVNKLFQNPALLAMQHPFKDELYKKTYTFSEQYFLCKTVRAMIGRF